MSELVIWNQEINSLLSILPLKSQQPAITLSINQLEDFNLD